MEAYSRGLQLAVEQFNRRAGPRDYRLELLQRDDGGTPAEAVRRAQKLLHDEHVTFLMGTSQSDVALAVSELAPRKRVLFFATGPVSDALLWKDGHRYVFRLRPSAYMQTAMLIPHAVKQKSKRWALVHSSNEDGQSAAAWFRQLMRRAQPEVEFVATHALAASPPDTSKVVEALLQANPDAIFIALGASDLPAFARQGHLRGLFTGRTLVSLRAADPEVLETLPPEAVEGWYVTGYHPHGIRTPEHAAFRLAYEARFAEPPKAGSLLGYVAIQTIAALLADAKSLHTEELVAAFEALRVTSAVGRIAFRAVDHQSTMGAYVGRLAVRNTKAQMVDWYYAHGAQYLPNDAFIAAMRSKREVSGWR